MIAIAVFYITLINFVELVRISTESLKNKRETEDEQDD